MKTFIVLLESTLFTSWKTCLSREKDIFISVSNMRFKIFLLLYTFYPLKTNGEYCVTHLEYFTYSYQRHIILHFKGSRQWESRGVWNVSNCPNLARTAAIEVRFSLNFAVVFDFMYFRFRPSKAKWIGDVLTNRPNAANYLQRFFVWSYFVYLPKCCGSGSPPQHCLPLHTVYESLRQY